MPGVKKEPDVKVRELRRADWPLILRLFGDRGACGGCWCMYWRREKGGRAWDEVKGKPNRQAFKKLVESGQAHGIIALAGNDPVGWCSFGPRLDFPRLDRTRAYRLDNEPSHPIWSINCLFLNRDYRGQGLAQEMAAKAVAAIKRRRGRIIEAYPVTLTKDGQRLPPAFAYTGPEIIYKRLGFKEYQRLAPSRPMYRLEIKARG
jgi:GNAT superfamily N-acetyltransferase